MPAHAPPPRPRAPTYSRQAIGAQPKVKTTNQKKTTLPRLQLSASSSSTNPLGGLLPYRLPQAQRARRGCRRNGRGENGNTDAGLLGLVARRVWPTFSLVTTMPLSDSVVDGRKHGEDGNCANESGNRSRIMAASGLVRFWNGSRLGHGV